MPVSITPKDERNTYADLFTQYLSDIIIEVEGIKIKADRNDIKGINEHIARINSALMGIMDTKLDLAEKCNISNISEITDMHHQNMSKDRANAGLPR